MVRSNKLRQSRKNQKNRNQKNRDQKNRNQKKRQNQKNRRQQGGNSLVTPGPDATLKWGPDTLAPEPLRNGGWFTGPQATGPWKNVYVPPTTSGMVKNLESANPPPGSMDQYPGEVRDGNNYYATPDIKNYETTLPSNTGPFKMHCTSQNGGRKNKRRTLRRQRKNGGRGRRKSLKK